MNTIERILQLVQNQSKNENMLAKACGINITSFSDWKRGKAKPSADAICKIANYFNVTTDYLFGKTDNPHPCSDIPKETEEIIFYYEGLNENNKTILKGYIKGLYEGQQTTAKKKPKA